MRSYQSPIPHNMPVLTFDICKKRMRLYRHILRLLNMPEYVQFLVHPEKKVFIVRPAKGNDFGAQKIYWTVLNDKRQCCEFYSKDLVDAIQHFLLDDKNYHTYRVTGDYYVRKNIVIFNLSKAEPIEDEPEALGSCGTETETDMLCTD